MFSDFFISSIILDKKHSNKGWFFVWLSGILCRTPVRTPPTNFSSLPVQPVGERNKG